MCEFYDGTKLLSLLDIDGNKPEIYMVTTNRSGGKTVYFSKLMVNKFLKSGEKFGLIYRYNYELDSVADKFFKDIQSLFFNDYTMESERRANGIYHELFLIKNTNVEERISCGYAISLNSADQIKKMSHLMSDIQRMLFDEFQSETNHYCDREIEKLISVHTSIARGGGKSVRYVPIYMCGNATSILNPYYTELGVSERIQENTKFLRGEGFVLEQGYIDSASRAQKESGFNKAFSRNKYVAYASENVYLNDNKSFVEKPDGKSIYLATLRYNGCDYALREFPDNGIIYCDDRPDISFKNRLSVTTSDHNINYVMLRHNQTFLTHMRFLFEKGCFRFKNLKCKECVLKALSY